MAACPPGQIFNPETYRCVKNSGRIGKRIIKSPPVAPILTRKATRRNRNFLQEIRDYDIERPILRLAPLQERIPDLRPIPVFDDQPHIIGRLTRKVTPYTTRGNYEPQLSYNHHSECHIGQVKNPESGKCIKIGGRVYQTLQKKKQTTKNQYRTSMRQQEEEPILRRFHKSSRAASIPLSNRETMKQWIVNNCSNSEEPFTGRYLRGLTDEEMEKLIKTSAGTCVRADYLEAHVRRERQMGRNATDPLSESHKLTLSNMDILGRQVRRFVPDYHVPQKTRKVSQDTIRRSPHPRVYQQAPPVQTRIMTPKGSIKTPSNWKFFLGKDARSGDDFYSIYYYDSREANSNEDGIYIPASAIKADIGIIPAYVSADQSKDQNCTTARLISFLMNLNKKGKLLHRSENSYIPAIELPKERNQWKTPDGAIQRPFFIEVCNYMKKLEAAAD